MKPLFDRVIIQPEKKKEKTESGIYLCATARESTQLGRVVSVGEGGYIDGKEQKMQVKKDDVVLYSKYAGTELEVNGQLFIVIRQLDILAIVE